MKILLTIIISFFFVSAPVHAGFFSDLIDPNTPAASDPDSLLGENNQPFQSTTSTSSNPFNSQLQSGAEDFGLGDQYQPASGEYVQPILFIMRWIQIGLTFLGIGTIAGILYAGVTWMTAGGDPDRIERAKKTLRNGVIGLVIMLSSYSITWFVARRIQYETGAFGNRGIQFGGEYNQYVD